ncbi:MAG: selenocysteine-specific translation elongation factor [Candidatus Marinimicrobia bacterium]|nr:selenocysteine-specific translation elongation factor [Candidatus Neomarinimicrobiota bacterium]MBL7009776.1 selenocysteine-specific translation elongation factor [Candidatus Neomarinimicrobiota bacterium]MBL7029820.1 selenocysteine-specific translation elongation factor [Candidatus Neomarinimicrobiota bacterium]
MQIVVGTAGHIDHGKTALVKALTGTDTDRLAEEKARGMTIDLGFAYLDQSITIIDVPGHEKFIRNMVAGVSTIHIALLVIAADDGIMPQTKEHLHILKLLGVKQGIIALTKTDLADDNDWIDLVELEIQELVGDTFLKDAPIVRTSIDTGEGIDTLKQAILSQSKNIETELDRGFFHLPVDRVFSKTGFGSVVTGTVLSGKTKDGQELEIIPGNQKAKVRGMQTHGTETSSVKMGDRAAINLAGTDLDELYRGAVIADPRWVQSTDKLIAHVTLIEDTRWKLKNRQRVHLHIGTAEVVAKAVMENPLEAGQSGNVLFLLEKPIAAMMDERFIIRSLSPMETMGGCVVLDSDPIPNRKELKSWVSALKENPSERFKQFVNQNWRSPKSLGNWSRYFQTTESQVKNWIKLEEIINEKGFLYTSEKRDESMDYIREVLSQFHEENPYKKSLSQERVKDATKFSTNWLSYILTVMGDELIHVEGGFALKSHSVVLSDTDASLAKSLEDSVKKSGYTIPTAKELSSENPKSTLEILHILKGEGKIFEVGRGMWIHGDVLDKLKDELCLFFAANPEMNVADFKSLTGTTRKSAIPLLEYCDKHGSTERVGDSRIKGENCG